MDLTLSAINSMKINPSSPEVNESQLLEVLASLNQISDAINHIAPGDAVNSGVSLQLIVETAIRVVPGSSAVIYTYDQATGQFEAESRVSAQAEGRDLPANPDYPDDAPRPGGIGIRTIQRRRRSLSYEEHDLDIHPYHAALGVNAVGCFPLIVAEQAVGILYIYLYEEREFTKLEQLMLDNFVNQAAMAIYHARRLTGVRRDLARKEEELSRLHRAGLIISSRLRLKETLESILQLALEVTNARYGIFRLVDRSGDFLITSAVGGSYIDRPIVEKIPLRGNSVMAHVARTRQPALIHDLREDPWAHVYFPLDSGMRMLSELAVPLVNSSGRLEGVLNVESPHISAFSENDSHTLQSLAIYAITAIQEVRLLDALQEVARLLISQPGKQVLSHIESVASDLLDASSSVVWILDENKELVHFASDGKPQSQKLKLQESLTGEAILLKKTIALKKIDASLKPNHYVDSKDWSRGLIIPLVTGEGGEVIGAFSISSTDADAGRLSESEWDEKVLTCLAHYAVLAIQNESHQQALQTTQEQHLIAETFAAVGDISSNLLHNVNNKVGTIPVRVQTIEDKYHAMLEKDAYLANNLKEIERCAAEAMQIVQENLSHLRPIRVEKVSVAPRVNEAIQATTIPAHIQIHLNGLEQLPMVQAGGQSLVFVFKNLIENAIDAMQGSGTITIQGHSSGKWVDVSMIDSGPGIPREMHDRIFELDFSGRTSRPGKLGFGLWWVKTLMTRLGGSVSVESDGSHGTTFRLRLPAVEVS
ncbi:MAG: GAF domain-containing protein [Anaerolineales bacterium]|nr:GAF domain-containing protein [Anaerolineales bacterium]